MVTFLALQIFGVLFGIAMLYFTFYYYKKNVYTYRSLTGWFFIWLLFVIFVLFPDALNPVLRTLAIGRTLDFFLIGGMFFFSSVVFFLYITVKRMEKRMETLVSNLAVDEAKKK